MKSAPVRKIAAEIEGDSAISFDVIKIALQLDRSCPKRDGDAKLIQIALLALENAMRRYETQMNKKYPTMRQLEDFLKEKDRNMPIL